MFITLEGIDGSGKSTHLKTVAGWFRNAGLPTITTYEPGGTASADAIRSLFLDPKWKGKMDHVAETLLLFASRRQHLVELIRPALAEGKVVVCDRFTDSTFAFQGFGRGVLLESIEKMDLIATGRLVPDMTFLFDLPAEEARKRSHAKERVGKGKSGPDRLDSEDLSFYERVRHGYLKLAEWSPQRFHIIDSSGTIDSTEIQIAGVLRKIPALARGE